MLVDLKRKLKIFSLVTFYLLPTLNCSWTSFGSV